MRNFILALVLLLGFIFIVGRIAELQNIAVTLQKGLWWYLGLALAVQILWTINCGASFQSIYRGMGIDERLGVLALIVSAASFVNIVAPSAGMSGMAILISEARRRNYSTARVTAAGVLFLFFDYLGLIAILAVGLLILIRRNDLTLVVILASAALVALVVLFTLLINLGMQSAVKLGNVLASLARFFNRLLRPFIHRDYLSEAHAREFALEAADALILMRNNPRNLVLPLILALSNKVALLMILTLSFLAFKVPVSIGTVIACFSIANLFVIISPTPAGMGFVEGALTLALTSMYISLGDAALITLSYRAVTFWLPMLAGMVSLRVLEKAGIKPNSNNHAKQDVIDAKTDV